MAVLFESSSPIEFLLKDALIQEGIDFQEQYLFVYLNMQRDPSYYDMPSDARLIGSELLSRCRQIRYGKRREFDDLPVCDYNSIFKA